MMHIKLVLPGIAGLVVASVTGCSSVGGYQTPAYRLANGSVIELTQTLSFPSGGARTYIQDGESKPWNSLSQWRAYCSFGLNATRDHKPLAGEIHPTTFTTGDTRLGSYALLDPDNPTDVDPDSIFARRGGKVVADSAASGASVRTFYTTITLHSDQEPQVDDLTCAYNGSSIDHNLTLAEIQATLGAIVRIQ